MRSLRDIDVNNKKVILRSDFNVPIKNGEIVDNNRIVSELPTINYLIENGAKVILMSHLGKVKSLEDKESLSLMPVKEELERLLNKEVKFSKDLTGENVESMINNLESGQILLLENTRSLDYPNKLESGCDESLSSYWASLADVFVLDAFGSAHRAHASTYGIAKYLPHAIGFLVEKEIEELNKIKSSEKTLILGGIKVDDKLPLIKQLLPLSKKILIGGGLAASFLRSKGYNIQDTLVNNDLIEEINEVLKSDKIVLPIDVISENGVKDINELENNEHIFDIGPKSIDLFKENIDKNSYVLMNGTLGKYEEDIYANATKEIFEFLEKNNIKTVVCGGDCGSASKKFGFKAYYLSTGGGAALEYLEGKEMIPLKIMEE